MTDLPDEIPEIPLALLLYLEAVTPSPLPTPTVSIEQIMFDAGAYDVVRRLRFMYDDQHRSTTPDDSPIDLSDPRYRS